MTPYRIIVNSAYNFRVFNFRTSHAVRKHFNNKNFPLRILAYKTQQISACSDTPIGSVIVSSFPWKP